MGSDDPTPTRRSVLKASGAAVGAAAAATAGVGTASAVACRELQYDYKSYRGPECPRPGRSPDGPIIEAGTMAYAGCTNRDGQEYLYALGTSGAGYVPKGATEPC